MAFTNSNSNKPEVKKICDFAQKAEKEGK